MAEENAPLVAELKRFRQYASRKQIGSAVAAMRGEDILLLTPREYDQDAFPGKEIGLTLMGLTHGNESAGLAILNEILQLIEWGALDLRFPLALVLGNVAAAQQGKRFLEQDLNRSFAASRPAQTAEAARARLLEDAVLSRTAYLVDFHQTLQASDRPFFIFPYSEGGYRFARDVRPGLTVVTHWGEAFSKDGFCTDEYVNQRGGVGITVELGRAGLDPYQIDSGVLVAQWAARVVAGYGGLVEPLLPSSAGAIVPGPLMTWAAEVPWPETTAFVDLLPGFHNFAIVRKGQRLGSYGGKDILAPADGHALFAKYLPREQQASLTARPAELMRLVRPIVEQDLP